VIGASCAATIDDPRGIKSAIVVVGVAQTSCSQDCKKSLDERWRIQALRHRRTGDWLKTRSLIVPLKGSEAPPGVRARDLFVPDLPIDTLKIKSRDVQVMLRPDDQVSGSNLFKAFTLTAHKRR